MFKNMNNYEYMCVLFTGVTLQQIDKTLKLRIETILLVVVWFNCNIVVLSHLFIHCFQLTPPPKNWEGLNYCSLYLTIKERYTKSQSTLCHFNLPSFNKWIRFLRMTFAFSYLDGPATAISASCSINCLFLYSCSSNAALYASTVWAASSRRRNWASY